MITAEKLFLNWASDLAVDRVEAMAIRYTDNPSVFCEAHSVSMPDPETITAEEGFNILMRICCAIVAPDWLWSWSFDALSLQDETPYVWVRSIHG